MWSWFKDQRNEERLGQGANDSECTRLFEIKLFEIEKNQNNLIHTNIIITAMPTDLIKSHITKNKKKLITILKN